MTKGVKTKTVKDETSELGRYECTQGARNSFWTCEPASGGNYRVSWGRIGQTLAPGQTQTMSRPRVEKKIKEKIRHGYVLVAPWKKITGATKEPKVKYLKVKDKQVTLLTISDYEYLYIGEKMVESGTPINVADFVLVLKKAKTWDYRIVALTAEGEEAIFAEGNPPKRLSDVPLHFVD